MESNYPEKDRDDIEAHEVENHEVESIDVISGGTLNDAGKDAGSEEMGLFELVYGILFDPVATFKRITAQLPIGRTVFIFSLVKVLSVSVLWYTFTSELAGNMAGVYDRDAAQVSRAMVPLVIVVVLVYEYIKWFTYSGTLHLLADLAGGSGRASGMLVVTGLASLPSLLFLPVQILLAFLNGNWISDLVNFIMILAALIWGFLLVVLGMRETQRIGAGSAVLISLIPAIIVILAIIFFTVMAVFMLYPLADAAA